MPVVTGVAEGFGIALEDNPEPFHTYTLVPPAPCAERFTVPPAQIGPSFVGAAVGAGVTVTIVVVKHPVDKA